MEYWKNGIKTYTQTVLPHPKDTDPIVAASHNGTHCLFYDPAVHKARIRYSQSLQDICDWINERIKMDGIDQFIFDERNWYDIANVVKLNMWVEDIKHQGIVKPMMLYYDGEEKFGINNGESRLRALTCLPEILELESFISTHIKYADNFKHLPFIENFEQFCEICRSPIGTEYLFTTTDQDAPYGIYWYEYNSQKTAPVTPGPVTCRRTLQNYLKQNTDTVFDIDWFNTPVDWNLYLEKHNDDYWS